MVAIALVVVGVLMLAAGLVIAAVPLTAVGGLWIVCGVIARAYAARVNAARRSGAGAHPDGASGDDPVGASGDDPAPAASTAAETTGETTGAASSTAARPRLGTFLTLTAINLVCGVPALAIGLSGTGFDAGHASWRWLPLIAGIGPTAIAVIGILMYGIGSAAKATLGDPPGTPAVIIIRSVRDTGVYVNNMPRLQFELEVRPEGQEPYTVTKRATVPFAALGRLEAGTGFHAMVAGRSDPTNMDIDWASGFGAQDGGDDPAERLRRLDDLRRQGLVTEQEYESQRSRIIGSV